MEEKRQGNRPYLRFAGAVASIDDNGLPGSVEVDGRLGDHDIWEIATRQIEDLVLVCEVLVSVAAGGCPGFQPTKADDIGLCSALPRCIGMEDAYI